MQSQNGLMKGLDRLSDEEMLELFSVEELDIRLEMAAIADSGTHNNATSPNTVQTNCPCW